MYQVMKRNGKIAKFDLSKICVAIEKAFHAQAKEYNQDIIDLLALKVTAHSEQKIKRGATQVEESYVQVTDWRVKENSTVTYSVGGLILSNSGAITANYWLSEIYDEEIGQAHRNADIHIHDLSMLTGYCAGWSLKQLIQEGLGGIPGKISSSPAKHLSVLCNQMVNFLGIMQNEW